MKSGIFHVMIGAFFLAGAALLLGAAILAFSAPYVYSYERIAGILGEYSNRSGAEFFSHAYYEGVIHRVRLAGLFLAVSSLGTLLLWKWSGARIREAAPRWPGRGKFAGLAVRLGQILASEKVLWAIIAAGALLRWLYLFQPASSDEVRGYYAWTARPLVLAVSDYRAPQHLLYTLLDFPVVRLFGNAEWAIRLPSFLAGVCLPLLAFVAGKRWFGRTAGLMAASLVAANPVLVHYSVTGRAYVLHAGLVLLLWLGAVAHVERPRLRWLALLVFAGAFGLMALPTTIYPLIGTYGWMALCLLAKKQIPWRIRIRNFVHLAYGGAATVWLGALAYLPAYCASDKWYSVDGSDVSQKVPWPELPGKIGTFFQGVYFTWNEGMSPLAMAALSVFFLAGVMFFWRRKALHLLVANLAGMALVLSMLRVVPYPRTAIYFGLGYWIMAGGGLAVAVAWFSLRCKRLAEQRGAAWIAGAIVLVLSTGVLLRNHEGFTVFGALAPGVRDAMGFMRENTSSGDHILCAMPASGPVYYYHLRNRMDSRLWLVNEEQPPREILTSGKSTYVLVNTYTGQTLDFILAACEWGRDARHGERALLFYSNRHTVVYQLDPAAVD